MAKSWECTPSATDRASSLLPRPPWWRWRCASPTPAKSSSRTRRFRKHCAKQFYKFIRSQVGMPKSIIIEPEQVLAKATIHFSDIPVNTYERTVEEEIASFSRDEFLAIWQDMCAIRRFETI